MCVHLHLIAGDLIRPDVEIMFAFSFSPTLLLRHQTCPDSSCPPGRLAPPLPLPATLRRLAAALMLAS